jgi:hypothetical protein
VITDYFRIINEPFLGLVLVKHVFVLKLSYIVLSSQEEAVAISSSFKECKVHSHVNTCAHRPFV